MEVNVMLRLAAICVVVLDAVRVSSPSQAGRLFTVITSNWRRLFHSQETQLPVSLLPVPNLTSHFWAENKSRDHNLVRTSVKAANICPQSQGRDTQITLRWHLQMSLLFLFRISIPGSHRLCLWFSHWVPSAPHSWKLIVCSLISYIILSVLLVSSVSQLLSLTISSFCFLKSLSIFLSVFLSPLLSLSVSMFLYNRDVQNHEDRRKNREKSIKTQQIWQHLFREKQ